MRAPFAAVFILAGAVAAEEQVPAGFSEGLERLAVLGLPPMAGAEWVKAPADSPVQSYTQDYRFRDLKVKLAGGAWKLPGDPAHLIGFGTAEPMGEIAGAKEKEKKPADAEAKEPSLLQKALRNHAASKEKEGGTPPPPPKPKADLAEADAKLLIEALAKEEIRKEVSDSMRYSRAELPGRLLIFAAQLHAAGKTEPASQLAGSVLSLAADKTAVIDAAVSHFASQEYEVATNAFFESRDWAAYETTLKALLTKYPRGWDQAGAVVMLLGPVEKRVKGEKPPTPSLPGIELKPEALAALDAMLAKPDTRGMSDEELANSMGVDLSEVPPQHRARYVAMLRQHGGEALRRGTRDLWLLPGMNPEEKPGQDAISKLKAMGMDGLIALAAVAADPTLTDSPNYSSRRGGSYYSSNDTRTPEEIAKANYLQMRRPSSRGEIATGLLIQVVPMSGDDDMDEEVDDQSLQAQAVEFWKQNRDKTPVELAQLYFSSDASGSRDLQQMAGYFLASSAEPAAHAAFEKVVLSSAEAANYTDLVEKYLDTRKEAGKPFFDAYAKLLREAAAGSEDEEDEDRFETRNYQIKQAGGVEKYLKKLSRSVEGVPVKQMLEDALKAEAQEGEDPPITAISDTIAKLPLPEAFGLIGGVADKASPPQLMELYQILLNAIYNEAGRQLDVESPKMALAKELLDPFMPLLARTDELPKEGRFSSWARSFGARTVGDATLLLVETSAFPSSAYVFRIFSSIGEPEKLLPFVKTRVDAWSSGKEVPPWPKAKDVMEERGAEIEAKIAALPANEIEPYARTLSAAERLWMDTLVSSYGPDKEAPPAMVELNETVIDLKTYLPTLPHDAALLEKLEVRKGWRIDGPGLEKLTERMAAGAKEDSGKMIMIFAGPMDLGMYGTAMNVTGPDAEERLKQQLQLLASAFEDEQQPEAMAFLSVNNATDRWTVAGGKVSKLETKSDSASALKRLASMRESKRISPPFIQITVLTREDARKILNEE